jgi:CheY-like chemotaxis protein
MRENNGAGFTVIVVDDCEDIRLMLRVNLEYHGYLVLEAENGQVAIDLASLKCPNLILMDLNMPVLDGLVATRILRELKGMCDVPIIAISASPKEISQTAARAAGCNEYLSKPVNLKELDQMISSLLAA